MASLRDPVGNKIDTEEAMDILSRWKKTGSNHGMLYSNRDSAFITTIITISKFSDEYLVCGPKPSSSLFKIAGAKFIYGPMMTMVYPETKDAPKGLHIYMASDSYIFIADKAELPESPAKQITGF